MQLESNEIHIWSTALTLTPDQENEKLALLSTDERARALRYHFALHRQRYIAARSYLRQLLSHYLPQAPEEFIFAYAPNGKPYLNKPAPCPLQFNLSHSNDMAVYAFTLNHPIGIDIEKVQPAYTPGIAERFFSAQENKALSQCAAGDQSTRFYRIWSRKEAVIKATGKGLALPLSSFTVSANETIETITLDDHQWTVLPLSIHAAYQSAAATNQHIKKITYWS